MHYFLLGILVFSRDANFCKTTLIGFPVVFISHEILHGLWVKSMVYFLSVFVVVELFYIRLWLNNFQLPVPFVLICGFIFLFLLPFLYFGIYCLQIGLTVIITFHLLNMQRCWSVAGDPFLGNHLSLSFISHTHRIIFCFKRSSNVLPK